MNPALFLLLFAAGGPTVTLAGHGAIATPTATRGAVVVIVTLSGAGAIAATTATSDAMETVNQPTFSTPLSRVFTAAQTYTQGIGLTSSPDTAALPLTLPGSTVSVSA